MKQMVDIIKEHPFFSDLTPENLAFVAGCGKNVHFKEGEVIAKQGDPANTFYLIRQGRVAISINPPLGKPFLFRTLGNNEILGVSWLIPPYSWTSCAHAVRDTLAIALDGACIRKKCEEDNRLGYKLMKHLAQILVERDDAAKLHVLDVYGKIQTL